MALDFKFPDVGEGIAEGEIVKWLVKEGDQVKQDQPIVEVETDKAVVEIPAPSEGTILKIYHKEGDTVKVGEVLVSIGRKGEAVSSPSAPAPAPAPKMQERKTSSVVGELEEAPPDAPPIKPLTISPTPISASASQAHIDALPAVRRLAQELNVDLSKLKGTGHDGRVTEDDVRKFASQKNTLTETKTETILSTPRVVKKYDMWGYLERIPLKGARKATAKHMVESKMHIPHVTHMEEIDVTELWEIREKEKKLAEEKGIHLTFLPFIVRALIIALKEHPYLNSSLDEATEEILLKKYFNIGIAVDSGESLLVPVIKIADKKSILSLAQEIERLAKAVKEKTIDLGDMKGGTFTITNVGSLGGRFATPIVNYPEAAILALGKIDDRVVAREGAMGKMRMEIRKILPVSLAFDHRILDGAEAARFTNTLKKHLEDPGLLLVEAE